MASQIAHIIYTDKFFKKLDSGRISDLRHPVGKIDRDEFMLGSVFPDIRLIDKNIKRQDTHMFFDTINLDFSDLTSFEAGWKFHLYCDMKRDEILNNNKFYSLKHTFVFAGRPSKFIEDMLVYREYSNWEKLNYYFNHPPIIETLKNISQDTFYLWYAILARYIEREPDVKSIKIAILKFPSMAQKTNEIADLIEKISKNKKAVEILLKVKEEII